MNNRTAMGICIAVLFTIILLVLTLEVFGARPGIKASADRPPSPAPIPSTPDTALPIISTAPPSTTLPPETTTTTTEPEPEPQPEPEPPAEPEVQGEAVISEDAVTAGLVRIAQCEQPGDGAYGVNWAHRGSGASDRGYQGGLGLWYGTWDSFKPAGAPDNAGDATIEQQLQAGRNIHARYGFSAWGCAKRVGLA